MFLILSLERCANCLSIVPVNLTSYYLYQTWEELKTKIKFYETRLVRLTVVHWMRRFFPLCVILSLESPFSLLPLCLFFCARRLSVGGRVATLTREACNFFRFFLFNFSLNFRILTFSSPLFFVYVYFILQHVVATMQIRNICFVFSLCVFFFPFLADSRRFLFMFFRWKINWSENVFAQAEIFHFRWGEFL